MRIITLSINGIRAAARKRFFSWMVRQRADVVCLQETKVQYDQIETDPIYFPKNYRYYHFDSQRKGYSGVAMYTRQVSEHVIYGLDWPDFAAEGRYLRLDFNELRVIGDRPRLVIECDSCSGGPALLIVVCPLLELCLIGRSKCGL